MDKKIQTIADKEYDLICKAYNNVGTERYYYFEKMVSALPEYTRGEISMGLSYLYYKGLIHHTVINV